MEFCDDNDSADKRLNCEYSGPPKSATDDQLQILQQICPHLVEEVTPDDTKEPDHEDQSSRAQIILLTKRVNTDDYLKETVPGSNRGPLLQLFSTD